MYCTPTANNEKYCSNVENIVTFEILQFPLLHNFPSSYDYQPFFHYDGTKWLDNLREQT